jgi:hypothetical protein
MSAWQEWKKSQVKPWHLLNPKTNYVNEELFNERFNICKSCPELIELTKQCKQCGCFMSVKAKLELAQCPLNKW